MFYSAQTGHPHTFIIFYITVISFICLLRSSRFWWPSLELEVLLGREPRALREGESGAGDWSLNILLNGGSREEPGPSFQSGLESRLRSRPSASLNCSLTFRTRPLTYGTMWRKVLVSKGTFRVLGTGCNESMGSDASFLFFSVNVSIMERANASESFRGLVMPTEETGVVSCVCLVLLSGPLNTSLSVGNTDFRTLRGFVGVMVAGFFPPLGVRPAMRMA